MSDHAYLPPSSAHAWAVCSMWPTMSAKFPEIEPQQESLEGQAAHWVIHETLTANRTPLLGELSPQRVPIDDEMLEGAEIFVDAIEKLRGQELHVEERIVGKTIHDRLNWGTPDLWTFKAPFLDVYDYKHGHEFVEVFENWQLINYVALLLEKLGINGGHDDMITVRMHVVQPRSYTPAGPVRTWVQRASHLRGYFNRLRLAADKAADTEPIATVNPACKHCPGRHACTMLQRVAQSAADQAGHALPVELPPAAIGVELRLLHRAAAMLSARITGLEAQATALLRNGTSVPHYMIDTVAGRESWAKPVDEVLALGNALQIDLNKPGVITPNQARKKGLAPGIVEAYATRGTAQKLVPSDTLKARKVFG